MKKNKIQVLTHRGLDLKNRDVYPESSFESIRSQLKMGYGIEVDINSCTDDIVISHDSNIERLTGINKQLRKSSFKEIKDIRYGKNKLGRFTTLSEILKMLNNKPNVLCALHLKGYLQTKYYLDILIKHLKKYKGDMKSILIFDLFPESAKYIKDKLPHISLGCSVSNTEDRKKYNKKVFDTLLSLTDAISNKRKGFYNWCIIDEWQKSQSNSLYDLEVFDILKTEGFKILAISPELHEDHEDNKNNKKLFKSIYKILDLSPDAICTNYQHDVLKYIEQKGGYKVK